jgi:hypothetical protein
MGTNYYLKFDKCQSCDRAEEELHIGKSSAGWCFTLHVYPERGINSMVDWIKLFASGCIQDEYGRKISPTELIDVICDRSWPDPIEPESDTVPGPNNLIRHKLGSFCIGHGAGTYDYCIGDFF